MPEKRKFVLCNGETTELQCGQGWKIHIMSAYWGRDSPSTCPTPLGKFFTCANSASSILALKERCSGRESCIVTADDKHLTKDGNHCPGIDKYALISYRCQPPSDVVGKWAEPKLILSNKNFFHLAFFLPRGLRCESSWSLLSFHQENAFYWPTPVISKNSLSFLIRRRRYYYTIALQLIRLSTLLIRTVGRTLVTYEPSGWTRGLKLVLWQLIKTSFCTFCYRSRSAQLRWRKAAAWSITTGHSQTTTLLASSDTKCEDSIPRSESWWTKLKHVASSSSVQSFWSAKTNFRFSRRTKWRKE